jgi:hypothetical protein
MFATDRTFTFVNSRMVRVFGDKSELLYLDNSDTYVWQWRTQDGEVVEVPIMASDDLGAIQEVWKIVAEEYHKHILNGDLSVRGAA